MNACSDSKYGLTDFISHVFLANTRHVSAENTEKTLGKHITCLSCKQSKDMGGVLTLCFPSMFLASTVRFILPCSTKNNKITIKDVISVFWQGTWWKMHSVIIGRTCYMFLLHFLCKNIKNHILNDFLLFSVKTYWKTRYLSFQCYFLCLGQNHRSLPTVIA